MSQVQPSPPLSDVVKEVLEKCLSQTVQLLLYETGHSLPSNAQG